MSVLYPYYIFTALSLLPLSYKYLENSLANKAKNRHQKIIKWRWAYDIWVNYVLDGYKFSTWTCRLMPFKCKVKWKRHSLLVFELIKYLKFLEQLCKNRITHHAHYIDVYYITYRKQISTNPIFCSSHRSDLYKFKVVKFLFFTLWYNQLLLSWLLYILSMQSKSCYATFISQIE